MENQTINRSALGRTYNLGDLYDAREENFCGISIFNKSIPENALTCLDADYTDLQMVSSDDFSEKADKLQIGVELKLSILFGIIKIKGYGRYLQESRKVDRNSECSLIYRIKTKDEYVNIYNNDMKEALDLNALQQSMATHVVVGVSWGANLIMTCTQEFHEDYSLKEGEGRGIQAALNLFIVKLSVSNASGDYRDLDHKYSNKIKLEFHGDVLADGDVAPTTFEGAMHLIKRMPQYIANVNNGKGKPLSYKLLPISLLQNHLELEIAAGKLFQTIQKETCQRFLNFLTELSKAENQVEMFYKKTLEYDYCVEQTVFNEISAMKTQMDVDVARTQEQIADAFRQVMSGENEMVMLESLLQEFESTISGEIITAKLREYDTLEQKMNFAGTLKQNGAKYIGTGTSFDNEIFENYDNTIFILFYSDENKMNDADEWTENRQLFFHELRKRKEGHEYFVVDCDIYPDKKIDEYNTFIQVWNSGKILVKNLLEEQKSFGKYAYAWYGSEFKPERMRYMPSKRVPLRIPCTGITCSKEAIYEWKCKVCKNTIDYGFNEHVYCKCGKTPASVLEFQCSDPDHGREFQKYEDEEFFMEYLNSLRDFQETNILLLGEIGVGKSTFINALANYIKRNSLDEAEKKDLRFLIPSRFKVQQQQGFIRRLFGRGSKEVLVTTGIAKNEVFKENHSTTQHVKVYPFRIGEHTLRIIDTPGIGDIRGSEHDVVVFESILDTLSNLRELHGVLILFKPECTKLDEVFRFAITELLTQLGEEANKNILFGFTHSRETHYQPGEGQIAIEEMLSHSDRAEIPVIPNTVYCFDNEPYRYLAALKNKPSVKFPSDERENCSISWNKTVEEILRMLKHLRTTEPYTIPDSLDIYQSRHYFVRLAPLLAKTSITMLQNMINEKTALNSTEGLQEHLDEQIQALENADDITVGSIKENLTELEETGQTKRSNLEECEMEFCEIAGQYAKLICFLNASATTQYTDDVEGYLDHIIQGVAEGENHSLLEYIETQRSAYVELKNCAENSCIPEIADLIEQDLKNCRVTWKSFKYGEEALQEALACVKEGSRTYKEVVNPALGCTGGESTIQTWFLEQENMA